MLNIILSWVKENYEKLILYVVSFLFIIAGSRLFFGGDREKELQSFADKIKPSQKITVELEPPIYEENLGAYLIGKPFSYYKPLYDRAVFFPLETMEEEKPSPPEMNLKCTEILSAGGGIFTATLEDSKTNKIYKVRVRDQVEDFTVVAVSRDGVTLSGQGKQYTLKPPVVTMPFKLTGIMPVAGGLEVMLQNTLTRQSRIMGKGGTWNNWEILNITENTVIISREDAGKYELKIGGEFKRIED
jgi:hypothetical protein